MRLYVKNKMFSITGASKVLDEQGREVFHVKGSAFSLTRKKKICLPNGEVLYIVKNRFLNFFTHKSYVCAPDGEKMAEVSNGAFSISFHVEGYRDQIDVQGNWFRAADLIKNGQVAGHLSRSFQGMSDLFRDSYELEIWDNAETPFWVALAIAVDNIIDNRQR